MKYTRVMWSLVVMILLDAQSFLWGLAPVRSVRGTPRLLRGTTDSRKLCVNPRLPLNSFPAAPHQPLCPALSGFHGSGAGGEDAKAFTRVSLARVSTKFFDGREIPEDVLRKVLALVSRAPSSFNSQPYMCIVVTSEDAKHNFSRAMLGPNRKRVLEAGATVVFAADLNSFKNMGKLRQLLEEEGKSKSYIRTMALYLSVFSSGHNRFVRLPLVLVKKLVFGVIRRLGKGMPTVSGAETWAFKNTMLAVQVMHL
ncbi:unnamed protein product, partial [Choristocarpus tenellus]